MTQLYLIREGVQSIVAKFDVYLAPLGKFLLAFITLLLIRGNMGFNAKLSSMTIVLVLALICSFMPTNFIIVCTALFIVANVYKMSMEAALVIGMLFLLVALLYFRFSPKEAIIVMLTPIAFVLHIPYIIPILVGLLCGPSGAIGVACGVIGYYACHYLVLSEAEFSAPENQEMSGKFKIVVDNVLYNKTMLAVAVSFVLIVLLVYAIRRASVDYSWTIAIIVGAIMQLVVLLVAKIALDADYSILGVAIGSVLAGFLGKLAEFFFFNVDYARTELVQFEDDEYYYYVKAVPKVLVTEPDSTVKQINSQSRKKRRSE